MTIQVAAAIAIATTADLLVIIRLDFIENERAKRLSTML
jgi:hypothetical protein